MQRSSRTTTSLPCPSLPRPWVSGVHVAAQWTQALPFHHPVGTGCCHSRLGTAGRSGPQRYLWPGRSCVLPLSALGLSTGEQCLGHERTSQPTLCTSVPPQCRVPFPVPGWESTSQGFQHGVTGCRGERLRKQGQVCPQAGVSVSTLPTVAQRVTDTAGRSVRRWPAPGNWTLPWPSPVRFVPGEGGLPALTSEPGKPAGLPG